MIFLNEFSLFTSVSSFSASGTKFSDDSSSVSSVITGIAIVSPKVSDSSELSLFSVTASVSIAAFISVTPSVSAVSFISDVTSVSASSVVASVSTAPSASVVRSASVSSSVSSVSSVPLIPSNSASTVFSSSDTSSTSASGFGSHGIPTVKQLPDPRILSASTHPSCTSAIHFTTESPSPK